MRTRGSFLGTPTLGGKLTILNCLIWAVVAVGEATHHPFLTYPSIIVCWPIAGFCQAVDLAHPSPEDVIVNCVIIGINSVLWGYGIAWIASAIHRMMRPTGPEDRRHGFDVIPAPPDRERKQ